MDLNYSSHKSSLLDNIKYKFSRLSKKVKITILCVSVLLFYWVFLRSSKSEPIIDKSSNLRPNNNNKYGSAANGDAGISKIDLSYMNLKEPFLDLSTLRYKNYINGGSVIAERDSDHVVIVPDSPSVAGYLYSRNSISIEDSSALEIMLDFRLHGSQRRPNLIGDGMAVWLTDEQLKGGEVFGMQSDYQGLGIFLDTYKNGNNNRQRSSSNPRSFPYLSLQPNYGTAGRYVKDNDGFQTELDGCSLHRVYDSGNRQFVSKMRIVYLRSAHYFRLDVDIQGDGRWIKCVQRNDFPDNLIPLKPYIGISAATGELHHAVDVYGLTVTTFRTKGGQIVENKKELLDNIGVDLIDDGSKANHNRPDRRNLKGIRRRRTYARLERQERELKRKDAEKYGNPNGFIGWIGALIWTFLKRTLYTVLIAFFLYFCWVGYRVYRARQRTRMPQGLL